MDNIKEKIAIKLGYFSTILFILFSLWRVYLGLNDSGSRSDEIQIWAATYQIIAWLGAICGFYFSGLWGGWRSVVGRANLAFAFGLLAQSFGQSVFSYFFYRGIDVPYPSLADIGFFGSIPFYIYGAWQLIKFSNVKISFKSVKNLLLAFIIPLAMLILSYLIFLKSYEFDWTDKLKIILDFGYPLGQAIYVSLAILALLVSKNIAGGIMRKPALLFIFSLVMQYAADYTFLYTSNNGTFVGGGIVDYMYLLSYFLMSISLIQLGVTFYKIRNS